ncbi:hypothetical protein GCG54_00011096 [Colletotrichum gloeosporioides]|uniref:GPI inositol-deacylase winged helix domain-containing protein n=1 Tax=Colletotrichum gloeosporioides TaxID=474922 RepID=A0A8H4CRV8_COLGL|nr:uncharacterized protein GCG54_00011096 [Colletotrichum gloeosporioides]KAF3808905.1 hypothetical protein GCG54_00011096 [Colletotrichum gloeosporioides]
MLWVKSLIQSTLLIRLLVTCRGEYKTRLYLEGSTDSQIILGGEMVGKDIRAYVHGTLSTRETFRRWRREGYEIIQKEIGDSLMAKADDPASLRRELKALPDDLVNTYAAILKRIPKRSEAQSVRLLQFLALSERPLRIKEAVDLLAVDPDAEPRFDPHNRMPIPEEITGYCPGLVIIAHSKDHWVDAEIQLAHATVKEYLLSDRLPQDISALFSSSLLTAATSVTEICLAYLLDVELVPRPDCECHYEDEESTCDHGSSCYHYQGSRGVGLDVLIKMKYPFARYAADYWMKHALHANTPRINALLEKFIDCDIFHQLYRTSTANPSALYHMANEGLTWAIETLLKKDATLIDARKDESLLAAAIRRHNDDTFYLLLARGAKIDENALVCASSRGNKELFRLLIGQIPDADVWAWCGKAAKAACEEGHIEILQMILQKCDEANIMCCVKGDSICVAFKRGHDTMVRVLLDKPPHDDFYCWSLKSASRRGLYKLVEMILTRDTDADAADRRTQALSIACQNGRIEIVKLLLNNGAETQKSVYHAASMGNEEILQVLLANGGDPNARYGGETALQAACFKGHTNIVRALLELGASDKGLFGPL